MAPDQVSQVALLDEQNLGGCGPVREGGVFLSPGISPGRWAAGPGRGSSWAVPQPQPASEWAGLKQSLGQESVGRAVAWLGGSTAR